LALTFEAGYFYHVLLKLLVFCVLINNWVQNGELKHCFKASGVIWTF